jgi:DNA-directed RNA polymerase subunit M/transcription elongation factor TFIIS
MLIQRCTSCQKLLTPKDFKGEDSRCKNCLRIAGNKPLQLRVIEVEPEKPKVKRVVDRTEALGRQRKYDSKAEAKWAVKRRMALKANLSFEVGLGHLQLLQEAPCFYCDDKGGGTVRLDLQVGFTEANLVSCCKRCNLMKRDMHHQEFMEHVSRICTRREERHELVKE